MASDILVKVGADISDYSKKMSESSKKLTNFSKANQETFDAFKKTGAVVTGAGVALAGGLGVAVKTAADFESAMSQVKAISGATGGEFDSLRDKAIEMGNKTMFSASESADAMSNLAQMGWKTDEILSGIEHTLNLAAAGGIELADSAMITANTMNQFGLEAAEAERVADVFALTASSAGTDVMEMADAMQYAGANAAAAGMDIEQTAAFIGVLGDAGITGSKAGTAFNAMLRDLKKNSEDGAIAVGEQSVALYDAEGKMRPMPQVISEIIKATEGMSDAQRDAALSTIMGDQALVGFNAIAGQGADAIANLAGELYDSEGAAKDMADIMMDNLQGALTELGSAFEGVQIALGSALIPVIRKATEWLTKLADWFNSLSDSTKTTIAIVAGVASVLMLVVGPMLLLIGFIPQIIAGFNTVITVFTAVSKIFRIVRIAMLLFTSPIGLIIAAVVGLAYLIYRYWDEIKAVTQAVWGAITDFLSGLWDGVKEAWNSFIEWVSELWESIKEITSTAWTSVKESIVEIWNSIVEFFTGIWDWIVGVFQSALNWIDEKTNGKFSGVLETITGYMEMVWGIIKDVWKYVKDTFKNALKFVKSLVTGDFEGMKETISDQMENARKLISNIWNRIKDFFGSILGNIWTTIKNKFTDIVNSARDKMNEAKQKIEDAWNKAVDFLKNIDLMQIGKDIIDGLINGIKSKVDAVKNAVSDVASGITTKVKEILKIKSPSRVLAQIGRWTGEGLADGITQSQRLVERATEKIAEAATPDAPAISLAYDTPAGVRSSLASAVSGTVDVRTRDDMLATAIGRLERRLGDLEVVMDGRVVGRIVEPHVTEQQEFKRRRFND